MSNLSLKDNEDINDTSSKILSIMKGKSKSVVICSMSMTLEKVFHMLQIAPNTSMF